LKLYRFIIRLKGGLATPLKGDTLFGQYCWQVAHDPALIQGDLGNWIKTYPESPWAVFSSAFPCFTFVNEYLFAFRKPDLPLNFYFGKLPAEREERYQLTKSIKKTKWLMVGEGLKITIKNETLASDQRLLKMAEDQATFETKRMVQKAGAPSLLKTEEQSHNTIRRTTNTTGPGAFAPYVTAVPQLYKG